jgi:excisionase family DNA binding protein
MKRLNDGRTENKGREETEIFLTAGEVARILRLSTETLAHWRSERRGIPFLKVGRKSVLYRRSDLNEWLDAHLVRVEAEPPVSRRKG